MRALNVSIEDYLDPKHLEDYLSYLRLEKDGGLSEGTVQRYILNLKHLCLQAKKPLLEIKTYADLSSYIRGIRADNGWAPATAKNAADSFSVFYCWAARFLLIDHNDNPMRMGHEFTNKNPREMEFFEWTDDDFKKMMYHPNNSTREKAILHALRSSGIRASDLCNLTVKDVNLEEGWFFIKNGKGGKNRYAPFDPETRKYLEEYLASIKPFAVLPWVFLTEDFHKMTPQTLYKFVRRKCDKLGMAGYPQMFRRSLGGELIANGADLSDVQHVLGHASIQTTARHYVRHKSKRLKQRYENSVPSFRLSAREA